MSNFLDAKLIQFHKVGVYTVLQYVLGYFGCVGMLMNMNCQFVLIISLHLSNGIPRC